jgi:putative transposase
MPWKETCAMDERSLLIAEYLRQETSIAELGRCYGVSRKTIYKWIGRHEVDGFAGLSDRSRSPAHCPHRLSEEIAEWIVAVRATHPTWGPKKILFCLEQQDAERCWPALSTIGEVLKSRGLVKPRKRRLRVPPMSTPFAGCAAANKTWTADFKGWFVTGDGRRCDPFTLSDAYSRYLLRCQAVPRQSKAAIWPIFDAAFREFGLPDAVRTDNGPPFAGRGAGGLSRLAVLLVKAGVVPERIRPGRPQENGRHERMHLTLKQDTADPPAVSLRAQQRRFDAFREIYNNQRPHEALKLTPPAKHYMPSPRRYSGRLRSPEYDSTLRVRRVRSSGEIKWLGTMIFVSEVLEGEPVALRELEDGRWRLTYGPVALGVIDHTGKLVPPKAPNRRRAPTSGA